VRARASRTLQSASVQEALEDLVYLRAIDVEFYLEGDE
jgi:hypothetical protein